MEKELIIFIGVGSSNVVAEYGSLYFSSLFNMAIRIEDPSNYPINYLSTELAKNVYRRFIRFGRDHRNHSIFKSFESIRKLSNRNYQQL